MEMRHVPEGVPNKESANESVVKACIEYAGQQYTGTSHLEAMQHILEDVGTLPKNAYVDMHEGFLTSSGRFVDRTEARAIAEGAGQLEPTADGAPAPLQSPELKLTSDEETMH